MAPTHGKASTYRHGCRCDPCKAANSAFAKRERVTRSQRPAEEIPHGLSGYNNWLCRCPVCKAAKSVENARRTSARVKAGGAS